jgi:hypothetical protein
LFLFRIAKDLGKTVEWVINNMSTVELRGWAEYITYCNDEEKKAQDKARRR